VPDETQSRSFQGVLCGLGAYLIWGFTPVYWKGLQAYPPVEILSHRILWSLAVGLLLLWLTRGFAAWRSVLRAPRELGAVGAAAGLLGANWLIFLYAVMTDRVLATSLGYYLNPLVNVLLGFFVLGERLRPVQWVAVACAAVGVASYLVVLGALPWIAVLLAVSFGLYGLIRKQAPVAPVTGFGVEMTLLSGPALGYLLWLNADGGASLPAGSLGTDTWLAASGVITAAPLLLFNAAAKRLALITVGILQYIAPSIGFVLAVVAYGEPFDAVHAWTFGWVWTGLALFTFESWRETRRAR